MTAADRSRLRVCDARQAMLEAMDAYLDVLAQEDEACDDDYALSVVNSAMQASFRAWWRGL